MLHEIFAHITPTEIIVSLISYGILHALVWVGRHAEQLARDEYQHLLIKHGRSHKGSFKNCEPCATQMIQERQEMLAVLPD